MLITALISPVRTPEVESRPDNFPEVTKLVHLRASRAPLAQVPAPYAWAALSLRTSSPMGEAS